MVMLTLRVTSPKNNRYEETVLGKMFYVADNYGVSSGGGRKIWRLQVRNNKFIDFSVWFMGIISCVHVLGSSTLSKNELGLIGASSPPAKG